MNSSSSVDPESALVITRSLSYSYGGTQILSDLDLRVDDSARIGLTGRSGSGKSTLLLLLAGLLPANRESVSWPGLDAASEVRRHQIGLIFQAPSLLQELTARENVALPMRLRGIGVLDTAERAAEALETLGLTDAADALPAQLSGGQQQRVAIARTLAGRYRLILADEPTGALDRTNALAAVQALLDGATAHGAAVMVATHDLEIAELCDQRFVLESGRLNELKRETA